MSNTNPLPGSVTPPSPTTEYTVNVYVTTVWGTGNVRGTGWVTRKVTAPSTILGMAAAIDEAVESVSDRELCHLASPKCEPNAAALGWPVGV